MHGSGQSEFYHVLRTITWSSNCCRRGERVTEPSVVIIEREQEREREAGSNRKSWIMLAFDLLHLPWHHVNKLRHSITKVAKQSKIIIHSCLYDKYQRELSDSIAFCIWMYRDIHLLFQRGSKLFSVNVWDFRFISRCREITRRIIEEVQQTVTKT